MVVVMVMMVVMPPAPMMMMVVMVIPVLHFHHLAFSRRLRLGLIRCPEQSRRVWDRLQQVGV
jgi:hypothetical protein